MTRITTVALFLSLVFSQAPALAQNGEMAGLINQQLDRQIKLQLSGTLPEAMRQITKASDVRVEADPAVWDALPWGKETAVTATIENTTLRQGLEAITRKLGLVFVLKSQAIELQPHPALRRLGTKATVVELQVLGHLAYTPLELKTDQTTLRELLTAVDLRLQAGSKYAIENRSATSPDNKVAQDTPLSIPRNATLMEALEAMTRQSTATWYPWGTSVVILPKADVTAQFLKKNNVTMSYDGAEVADVLRELSKISGVEFKYEPGALQSLSPQSRRIRLVTRDGTAQEALNAISNYTGLAWLVKDETVYIWNPNAAAAAPRDRTVAWIQTETGLTILITESQVPEDLREYIQFQKKKTFDSMRKMMIEQGFKPSTRPTTAPTEAPGKDL